MFAVFLLCVLRARYDPFARHQRAVQHIMRQCTTVRENKCCESMACGWCVAQTKKKKKDKSKKENKKTRKKKKRKKNKKKKLKT